MNTSNQPVKKYRLLKDIHTMDLTAKAGDIGILNPNNSDDYSESFKVWFDNGRYFFTLNKIDDFPDWFAPVTDTPVQQERITLKEFIEKFVEKNTLIRLWHKTTGGHEAIFEDNKPQMEWELLKGEYAGRRVIGITDILVRNNPYSEALNVTVERTEELSNEPTDKDLLDPEFNAIWNVIKNWDIDTTNDRPRRSYHGATRTDVMKILIPLRKLNNDTDTNQSKGVPLPEDYLDMSAITLMMVDSKGNKRPLSDLYEKKYTQSEVDTIRTETWEAARLTHPMAGMKFDTIEDYLKSFGKEFIGPAHLSEHPKCKKESTTPKTEQPKEVITDNSDVACLSLNDVLDVLDGKIDTEVHKDFIEKVKQKLSL